MSEDVVNHPKHYTSGFETKPVECIDITRHMSFCEGNAFKYVWRAGKKTIGKEGAIEDLNKAKWYLRDVMSRKGAYCKTPSEAAAVFRLISDDGSLRYNALDHIVCGSLGWAFKFIEEMIKEIEEDNQ